MKPISTTGPDVFLFNVWAQLLNKQAFRFYGNEIYDHGYCEPIGHGVHVYTVQLATLFESKTVELISTQGRKRSYCVGFKQAQYYRAGYDAGRAWFRKMYADPAQHLFGEGADRFVKQIHNLAFHKKTLFDSDKGSGVYGVKLLNVPVNKRALRWAGYYAAITAGIIDMVTRYTAVFHQHETCKHLTEGWTLADARQALRFESIPQIPYCEQRTYVIEKQPKIPIDMQDVLNMVTRSAGQATVTRENLPDYLTAFDFSEWQDQNVGVCRVFTNEKPGLTNLVVHLGDSMLAVMDGRPDGDGTYWEGEDPTELLNQVMLHANNLKPKN